VSDPADSLPSLPSLPSRDPRGHKGTFGTVAVVGGCAAAGAAMLGAPVLAARGALRSGVGLVRLVMPDALLTPAIQMLPSATAVGLPTGAAGRIVGHEAAAVLDELLEYVDAFVVGPGLGPADIAGDGVYALVLRLLGQAEKPVVVDADGINALAGLSDFGKDVRAASVFTPHPGEYRRLAETLGLTADAIDPEKRVDAAEAMAQRLGAVVALKGAGTVVSDGQRSWTCARGHAAMATAGTGDVLSGVIGGLIAQFVAAGPRMMGPIEMPRPKGKPLDLFDATRLGVELHARAGEAWADRQGADAGLLASELADMVPGVMKGMRG